MNWSALTGNDSLNGISNIGFRQMASFTLVHLEIFAVGMVELPGLDF
jgi:hypothetical protein